MESVPLIIALLAPLVAGALIALFGAAWGERVAGIGIYGIALSLAAAVTCLYQSVQGDALVFRLPGLPALLSPAFLVDRLAGVMMVLISGVSLVIHVYSRRYMQGDRRYVSFFGLISVLTCVLLALVTSGNLLWFFVSWHAVTWLLGTLLSFNPDSLAARRAGRTTVRVQAIGDAALLAAIALLYGAFGTFDMPAVFQTVRETPPVFGAGTWWEMDGIVAITLLLVLTVMTKSAQFPFHVWLPGTIEAPTPVSAMLHAGIVNAGGFLVNRFAPLFGASPPTLYVLFVVGAMTAFIGASAMLTQSSIKRTLVYSTMGQMGYMVMECGLGAFALAIFHLCAHGLFKATLFLNSGTPIQKARTEFQLPPEHVSWEAPRFAFIPWATGLGITLLLPLLIVLLAHGVVNIPLFEAQGTLIFLFFAWVTSSQAVFSLYRIQAVRSLEVSLAMLGTLLLIGLTYLWAGESFTHFLYPAPGQSGAYFQAAAWPRPLFDTFVAVSAFVVIAAWVVLYGRAHGYRFLVPSWLDRAHARLYVAMMQGLYVEDCLRALRPRSPFWLSRTRAR